MISKIPENIPCNVKEIKERMKKINKASELQEKKETPKDYDTLLNECGIRRI